MWGVIGMWRSLSFSLSLSPSNWNKIPIPSHYTEMYRTKNASSSLDIFETNCKLRYNDIPWRTRAWNLRLLCFHIHLYDRFHTKTVAKNYTSPIHIDSFPLKSVDRSANTLVHGRLTEEFCRKREESSIGEALATVISRRRNERALKIELSLG